MVGLYSGAEALVVVNTNKPTDISNVNTERNRVVDSLGGQIQFLAEKRRININPNLLAIEGKDHTPRIIDSDIKAILKRLGMGLLDEKVLPPGLRMVFLDVLAAVVATQRGINEENLYHDDIVLLTNRKAEYLLQSIETIPLDAVLPAMMKDERSGKIIPSKVFAFIEQLLLDKGIITF